MGGNWYEKSVPAHLCLEAGTRDVAYIEHRRRQCMMSVVGAGVSVLLRGSYIYWRRFVDERAE